MAPPRAVLLILTLITLAAAAANITTYIPECSRDCLEQSVTTSGLCSRLDDAECLCNNIATIGPNSRVCVIGACGGNSSAPISVRAGYTTYCDESGFPQSESGHFPPGWSQPTSTSAGAGATATSSSSSYTSTAAPTGADPAQEEAGGDDGGGGGSDLSKGAIAGIAVGGGIACILITGGLLFLAFRLGRKQRDGDDANGNRPEQGEGDLQKDDDAATMTTTTTTTTQERTKAQLDGTPVSELHAGVVVSGLDPIRELPTNERPAELSADPIMHHYDSPVLPQSPWR